MPLPEPHPSVFQTMQQPTPLLKYGQMGNPHFRYFFLSAGRSILTWHSDKKKPTQIGIVDMTRLERGQDSAVFKRGRRNHPEHLSFSVYYLTAQGSADEKSLDVVCKDSNEFDTWVTGLEWLIENKDSVAATAKESSGGSDVSNHSSVKLVDVETLRKQMNAHLDLCTWGNSAWGQLGHADKPDDIVDIDHPKKIRELIDKDVDVKFVSCGYSHTVAVSKTGECYAWGNAHSGRLGIVPKTFNGHFDHVLVPQCVETLRGVVTIASVACGTAHTLFLSQDGRLFATGSNVSGQLGTGDRQDRISPVEIHIPSNRPSTTRVSACAAGEQFSACVWGAGSDDGGDLYTWGSNVYGNLGHGDFKSRYSPTVVQSLTETHTVHAIVCGGFHIAIIATQSAEEDRDRLHRADSSALDDEEFSQAIYQTTSAINLAVSGRPELLTWGWGECGQLGHENFDTCCSPQVVMFLQRKVPLKMSAGTAHTACVMNAANGEERVLYVWGAGLAVSNEPGTPNTATPFAVRVPSSHDSVSAEDQWVIDVSCGDAHTLYLTETGFMHILGHIPSDRIVTRVEDYSDKDAKSIASGGRHFAVLVGRKWIDDGDTDKCMECGNLFMFVFRGRHHCRSCGGIYCDNCSRKRAPVLKYGFHEMVRVCDNCYTRINNGEIK